MKFVPVAVSAKLARTALKGQKHAPVLMFSAGVVGAVTSTVLACRATLKYEEAVLLPAEQKRNDAQYARENMPERYSEKDLARDQKLIRVQIIRDSVKLYAPAVGLGLVSIGLLTGSHVVLSKRNAAITAAYAALDKGFNEYRDRVREEFGEEKERELRFGSEEKAFSDPENPQNVAVVKRVNPNGTSIYARLFDEFNKNYKTEPGWNRNFIQCQQNWANDKLAANGHLFLNEVYDMLGMERTKEGTVVGWIYGKNGKDSYVDFGLFDDQERIHEFMQGDNDSVWLDFNVDGVIWDKF